MCMLSFFLGGGGLFSWCFVSFWEIKVSSKHVDARFGEFCWM